MLKVIERNSPNFDERNGIDPYIILLHYTGMENAHMALDRLTNPLSKVSSHYTIDEQGNIYRHVDESKRAWHAGQSYWQGETNINAVSIGVEIVNPGHDFGYKNFPLKQINAVKTLCLDVMARHSIQYVLGHSDVAPMRKQDPGEFFPWQELANEGIGVWPESTEIAPESDLYETLAEIGYDVGDQEKGLIAFQRHYVPEVFQSGEVGQITDLTLNRAKALLALT